MILQAIEDHPEINKDESLLIGDSDTDIQAAGRAGIPSYKIKSDQIGDHLDVILSLLKTST